MAQTQAVMVANRFAELVGGIRPERLLEGTEYRELPVKTLAMRMLDNVRVVQLGDGSLLVVTVDGMVPLDGGLQ